MSSTPASAATGRSREWLALPDGRIRPVVSVPGDGGVELLTPGAWLARLLPSCQCGRPRLGSGRTCGSAECVAELRGQEAGTFRAGTARAGTARAGTARAGTATSGN